MEETWKSICSHPGYSVSNLGRVRRDKFSVEYSWNGKMCKRTYPEIILKPTVRKDSGKMLVVRLLSVEGFVQHRKIHKIVGSAFLSTDKVKHISKDITDNSVNNLIAK